MPADFASADTSEPHHPRLASAVLPVALSLLILFVLSSAPASWAETTATVPRETPTRRVTPGFPPTETPVPEISPTPLPALTETPPATAVATAAPGQPTGTPAPVLPTANATATPGPVFPTVPPTPTALTPAPTRAPAPDSPTALPPATASASPTAQPSPASQLPTPTWTSLSPAGVAPAGGMCSDAVSTSLTIRWPDGRAALELPAGSITGPVCIFLEELELAALPAPPAGFRLDAPAVQIRATDAGGGALAGFAFALPATLTLRIEPVANSTTGFASLEVGFLGETSTDWALLETARDANGATVTVRPRRPGAFALLLPTSAPVATKPAGAAGFATMLPALLGIAIVIVVTAVALLIWRRRR